MLARKIQLAASKQSGFTLLELVAVLVLLGIISAVAFPRFASFDSYSDRVFRDTLLTSLRLAQRTALSHNSATVEWRLNRSAAENWRYAIDINSAQQTSETLASDQVIAYSANLSADGTIAGNLALNDTLTLRYDPSGNLILADDGDSTGALNSSMQLTANGQQLCISLTGFAYAGTCR